MYGGRDYLAHLGYGAIPLFEDEIIRGNNNFMSRKKMYDVLGAGGNFHSFFVFFVFPPKH